MPTTAGSVMLRAAAHLNDPNQLMYTNTVLLPFLAMAIDKLEGELAVHEVSAFKKSSAIILVDAGDDVLTSMPSDYVEPVRVMERPRDSDGDWTEIGETKEVNPNFRTSTGIVQWERRNTFIGINPPTEDREVLLDYIAGMTQAVVSGTVIDIEASRSFLALETARCTARDLGNAPSKAAGLERDIADALDRIVRRLQKGDQAAMGVRRLPYRGRSS